MAYPKNVIDKLDSKYNFEGRDRTYVASLGISETELPVTKESNYFRKMLTAALTVQGMEEMVASGMFDAEELIRHDKTGVSGLRVLSESCASQIVAAYEAVKNYSSFKYGQFKLKDLIVDEGHVTSIMSASYAEQVAKNPSRLNEIRRDIQSVNMRFFGGGQRVNDADKVMEEIAILFMCKR